MKRIEFIAPVDAMRGNLSGKQNLLYAENDNKAYEGPVGSVNYARNYTPRFVGAKIAKSGKKYFAVRTKTANHLTAKAKKAMALMGGTGAIVAAILRDKASSVYNNIYAQWVELQNYGSKSTFREYVSRVTRNALEAKAQYIAFAGPRPVVQIKNPWFDGTQTAGVTITDAILFKFWMELAPNGIELTIDGQTVVGYSTMTWGEYVSESSGINVLNLTAFSPTGSEVIGKTVDQQVYLLKLNDANVRGDAMMTSAAYVLEPYNP